MYQTPGVASATHPKVSLLERLHVKISSPIQSPVPFGTEPWSECQRLSRAPVKHEATGQPQPANESVAFGFAVTKTDIRGIQDMSTALTCKTHSNRFFQKSL